MSVPAASSQRLLQCLIDLEQPEKKSEAKMELITISSDLMPKGKPRFLAVISYPSIASLVKTEGKKKMLAVLVLLVKDFCGSMNVVRNMNEDQMIESAAMLLDECGNFRMEDYVMMFNLAKKGAFHPEVKIYDRIDIQVICNILDAYWKRRHEAGRVAQEAEADGIDSAFQEGVGRTQLEWNDITNSYEKEKTEGDKLLNMAGIMSSLKDHLKENAEQSISEQEARKQIMQNPNYKNPYSPIKPANEK
jgi:hypothetical protein